MSLECRCFSLAHAMLREDEWLEYLSVRKPAVYIGTGATASGHE